MAECVAIGPMELFSPAITAEKSLEEFEEAFALLESGEACKIVLRPNGATG